MALVVPNEAKAGFTFTAAVDFVSIAPTTEHPLLLLKNPAASGKKLVVTHFNFAVDSAVTRSIFKVYSGPTLTADGAALTETNLLLSDSPPATIATSFKNPTTSANGALLAMKLLPDDSPSPGQNRFIWVEEGHNILITVKNNKVNINTFAQVYWIEK